MGTPYTIQAEGPMIPIWAKDKEGNWQVFPQRMVAVHEDGCPVLDHDKVNLADWRTWDHLFYYDAGRRCFVLDQQIKPE